MNGIIRTRRRRVINPLDGLMPAFDENTKPRRPGFDPAAKTGALTIKEEANVTDRCCGGVTGRTSGIGLAIAKVMLGTRAAARLMPARAS
jgi:hypothetical protein